MGIPFAQQNDPFITLEIRIIPNAIVSGLTSFDKKVSLELIYNEKWATKNLSIFLLPKSFLAGRLAGLIHLHSTLVRREQFNVDVVF